MIKSGRTGRRRRKHIRQRRRTAARGRTRFASGAISQSAFIDSLNSYRPPERHAVREILVWDESQRVPASVYARAHWPTGSRPPIRVIDRARPWKTGQLIYHFG